MLETKTELISSCALSFSVYADPVVVYMQSSADINNPYAHITCSWHEGHYISISPSAGRTRLADHYWKYRSFIEMSLPIVSNDNNNKEGLAAGRFLDNWWSSRCPQVTALQEGKCMQVTKSLMQHSTIPRSQYIKKSAAGISVCFLWQSLEIPITFYWLLCN